MTSIGLAWTSMGGDTLIIEAIKMPGKGGLQLTGQMGDVMKGIGQHCLFPCKTDCWKTRDQTGFL